MLPVCRVSCRGAGGPSPAVVTSAMVRQRLAPGRHSSLPLSAGVESDRCRLPDPTGWWSVVLKVVA